MIPHTFFVALALALPAAESLEGTWRLEQIVADGRTQAKMPAQVWIFASDTLEIQLAGKTATSTKYTANSFATPATIDLTLKGEKPSIYEISEGMLRVAVPEKMTASEKRGYIDKREETANRDPDELERPASFGKHPFPVTVYVFSRVTESTPPLPKIIGRPPPAAMPTPPKAGASPAPPVDEAKKWPRVWRGNYFLPPSK